MHDEQRSTHAIHVLGELVHPPLEVPIEKRAQYGREHGALRDADHLTVVLVPDLDDILGDVLFEKCDDLPCPRVRVDYLFVYKTVECVCRSRESLPGRRRWCCAGRLQAVRHMLESAGGRLQCTFIDERVSTGGRSP